MKRLLSGIATILFGIFWTVVSFYAAFDDDMDLVASIVVLVLFTIPGLFMVYNGTIRIRNYYYLRSEGLTGNEKIDETPVFNQETTLLHWEIKGREWERFKERKCTPEAVSRAATLYSVASGIGAGGFVLVVLIEQPTSFMLSAGIAIAALTALIGFIFIRKAEYNKYGFANDLAKGELTITQTYANFCGKIIPLNVKKREVFKLQIIEKNGFSYLFFRIWKSSIVGWDMRFYEFPIPEDKLEEAKKLI